MININKKIMTATAIGFISFSIFLIFGIPVSDIEKKQTVQQKTEPVIQEETKIKKEIIQEPKIKKEIPKPEIVKTKIEIKEEPSEPQILYDHKGRADYSQFYNMNNTDERIANAEYIVRDDYYVPNTIEPFDDDKPYIQALFGEIANEYSIYYENAFENSEQKVNELENMLGYKIIDYDVDKSKTQINIKINLPEKTAQEVENLKEALKQMYLNKDIDDFFVNSGLLPEYSNDKYESIWMKSSEL